MVRPYRSCELQIEISFVGARSCKGRRTLAQTRRGRWQSLALFLAGAFAWAGSAGAQSGSRFAPPVESWLSVARGSGAESCPDRDQLASAVRSRLASIAPPFANGLSVRVTLSREGGGSL